MTAVQMSQQIDPCARTTPRCRTRYLPLFRPGISTRRIPLCNPVYCEGCREGDPNWWVNNQSTLDRRAWIKGWVANQLFTRGQANCEDWVLQQRTGGWWADSFRASEQTGAGNSVEGARRQFRSGSLLWTLVWSRVSNETLIRAKAYAYEAIQYLVSWGIATRIEISAEYVSRRVMHLGIVVRGPGFQQSMTIEGTAMPDASYLWTMKNA